MWDSSSFGVGIFVGLIILIVIFWIAYVTRTFVFATTPYSYPECRSSDYFNNPTYALRDGYTVDQILALDGDQMLYRRVPRDVCVPGENQQVHITNPQYCQFTGVIPGGDPFTFEARNHLFDTRFYTSTDMIDGEFVEVTTDGDCQPVSNTGDITVTDGIPLLQWDS